MLERVSRQGSRYRRRELPPLPGLICPHPFVWLSELGNRRVSLISLTSPVPTVLEQHTGDYNSPSQRKQRWGTGFWFPRASVSQCKLAALSARTHKQYHQCFYLPGVSHNSFPDDYQQLPASPRHVSSPREPSPGFSFLRNCFRSKIHILFQVFAWEEARSYPGLHIHLVS